MNDLELIQSFTRAGIIVDGEFTDDPEIIKERIKTHSTGPEWQPIFPMIFEDTNKKFNARKWSNKDILDELISCVYAACQEYCISGCHCSELARLARRRFSKFVK